MLTIMFILKNFSCNFQIINSGGFNPISSPGDFNSATYFDQIVGKQKYIVEWLKLSLNRDW